MKRFFFTALLVIALLPSLSAQNTPFTESIYFKNTWLCNDSRPWTRWWWFASVISKVSVNDNLTWLLNNGFGGVEMVLTFFTLTVLKSINVFRRLSLQTWNYSIRLYHPARISR